MAKKLYVGNLPHSLNENELRKLFEEHGAIVSAHIIIDRETGRSKGFGFVEMGTQEEADVAIAALNGTEVGGRPLTVNEARPQTERVGGSGGGFRGGPRGSSGGGFRGGNSSGRRY